MHTSQLATVIRIIAGIALPLWYFGWIVALILPFIGKERSVWFRVKLWLSEHNLHYFIWVLLPATIVLCSCVFFLAPILFVVVYPPVLGATRIIKRSRYVLNNILLNPPRGWLTWGAALLMAIPVPGIVVGLLNMHTMPVPLGYPISGWLAQVPELIFTVAVVLGVMAIFGLASGPLGPPTYTTCLCRRGTREIISSRESTPEEIAAYESEHARNHVDDWKVGLGCGCLLVALLTCFLIVAVTCIAWLAIFRLVVHGWLVIITSAVT